MMESSLRMFLGNIKCDECSYGRVNSEKDKIECLLFRALKLPDESCNYGIRVIKNGIDK